jgi:hypothetical protein
MEGGKPREKQIRGFHILFESVIMDFLAKNSSVNKMEGAESEKMMLVSTLTISIQ